MPFSSSIPLSPLFPSTPSPPPPLFPQTLFVKPEPVADRAGIRQLYELRRGYSEHTATISLCLNKHILKTSVNYFLNNFGYKLSDFLIVVEKCCFVQRKNICSRQKDRGWRKSAT